MLRLPLAAGCVALVSLVTAASLVPAQAWGAATILPNTPNDEYGSGAGCSLREAITSANGDADFGNCTHTGTYVTAESDFILLADGMSYMRTLADSAGDEDLNVEGDLDVLDDVTIAMAGTPANGAALQGDGTAGGGRVLELGTGTAVQISDATIRNGNSGEQGGGVRNNATLTLTRVTLSGNHAITYGGGISTGTTSATNLNNVTVSGNSTDAGGGGLFTGGTVNLNNVTVTGNTSDLDANTPNNNGNGGGLLRDGGTLNLSNTIVAANIDGSPGAEAPDCQGSTAFTSLGHNLIGSVASCTFAPGTGDITGMPPLLGSSANNGGLTPTRGLLPGSPAIDAGNPATPSGVAPACATSDQRNVLRPVGARCDIGAFEGTLPATPISQPAAGPTGKRAAALKKCKKKKTAKARAKCKRKANKLPA